MPTGFWDPAKPVLSYIVQQQKTENPPAYSVLSWPFAVVCWRGRPPYGEFTKMLFCEEWSSKFDCLLIPSGFATA